MIKQKKVPICIRVPKQSKKNIDMLCLEKDLPRGVIIGKIVDCYVKNRNNFKDNADLWGL